MGTKRSNLDPLSRWNIRERDQTLVGRFLSEKKLAEILVDRDNDALFGYASSEDCSITGIGATVPNLGHIVSKLSQSRGDADASATVDKKLQ